MKILYVCGARSFTKALLPRKLAEVAETWRKLGHEVVHVCGGDLVVSRSGVVEGGVDVRRSDRQKESSLKWPPCIKHSVSELRDMKHDSELLRYLNSVILKFQPDLVWERSCRLHNAGLVIAKQLKVPYVLEWKDHLVDYRFSAFRHSALAMEVKKNQEADHVVVESDLLRQKLAKEGVEKKKILVAHNAVDSSEFKRDEIRGAAMRAKLGVDTDTVLVGYLGSYAFYHDAVRLVLAAAYIRKNHPDRAVKFLMVGSGLEYERTRSKAHALGLIDKEVIMLPRVKKENVPDVLSGLDIAVLPGSTDIICPIKVQEYMAASLPSIIPDYPCNREVVEDGVTGIMFQPHDEASLARVILYLVDDEVVRRKMGDLARQEAVNRFSWEGTWGKVLLKIFNKFDRFGGSG